MSLKLDVKGEEKIIAALGKFPKEITKYMRQAGSEAAEVVLAERGLKIYPAATAANRPGRMRGGSRVGYYIRGRGWQTPTRGGGYRSLGNSERLGTHWKVTKTVYGVTILNEGASYAPYVHGEEQARVMASYGWRKLLEVVMQKLATITQIYQGWIDKLISDLGL